MAGQCRPARCGGCLRGSGIAQRQGPDSPNADRSPCHTSNVRASHARSDCRRGYVYQCGIGRHDVVARGRANGSTASPPSDSAICQPLRSRPAHYSLAIRHSIPPRALRRRWPVLGSQPTYYADWPCSFTLCLPERNTRVSVAGKAVQPPSRCSSVTTVVAAAQPPPRPAARSTHQPPGAHAPEVWREHRPVGVCRQYRRSPATVAG
jgi:hypothetical protein